MEWKWLVSTKIVKIITNFDLSIYSPPPPPPPPSTSQFACSRSCSIRTRRTSTSSWCRVLWRPPRMFRTKNWYILIHLNADLYSKSVLMYCVFFFVSPVEDHSVRSGNGLEAALCVWGAAGQKQSAHQSASARGAHRTGGQRIESSKSILCVLLFVWIHEYISNCF